MNRKYYILLLFLMLSLLQIQAKKRSSDPDQVKSLKNTISLNFSEPILTLLSKDKSIDSGFSIKAPILYYGRNTKKMYYRIGTRVLMKNTIDKSDLFSDQKLGHFNRYDATLSVLRKKEASPKITIGYGPCVTGFLLIDKKIFDSGFDKVTFNNTSWSVAGGVNFLAQYSINKRLSVFTEYILAYQFVNTYTGKEFSAFPEENYANEKSIQHGIEFNFPISINLSYHF